MQGLSADSSLPITIVNPAGTATPLDGRELWECRDLIEALVRRNIAVRYKQTLAGILWVMGQPILITLALSLLMGRLVSQPASSQPYPLFVYAALVPWSYITHALTKSTTSLIDPPGLVTRVYLPRVLLPLSEVLAALVDLAVTLSFLVILLIFYGVTPTLDLLALPAVVGLAVLATLGIGLILATLNPEYRDIAFALPFLLQLGMFATPVFYSSSIVPMPWRLIYSLNPMVGVVEGMRWACLGGGDAATLECSAVSCFSAVLIFAAGLYLFQKRDPELADVI